MHDAQIMQVLQRLQTLPDEIARLVLREHTDSLKLRVKLATLAVLHDKVHVLVVEIRLVERANVRMVHGQQDIQLGLQRRQILLDLDPLDGFDCIFFLLISRLMGQTSRAEVA